MGDMESLAKDLGLTYTSHQYDKHSLQKLAIWEFEDSSERTSGYWIIFIHGGAWRDPRNTSDDFWPSIKKLMSSDEDSKSAIRGFISIDYRLSPHPQFPQDKSQTPESEFRNARHPDHVQDIWLALEYLRKPIQLEENYILVGHSAGATLAFQLLMGNGALGDSSHLQVPLPTAIIGISGIYDLVGLNDRFGGGYAFFIEAAFGDDQAIWSGASPRRFGGSFKDRWLGGRFACLAWSPGDSLIDEPEIDNMAEKLKEDGVTITVDKDLHGEHDFVWEDGAQVRRLVIEALTKLRNI